MNTLKLLLAILMCVLVAKPGQFSSKEEVAALQQAFDVERKDRV
jgi:hypothetical protein